MALPAVACALGRATTRWRRAGMGSRRVRFPAEHRLGTDVCQRPLRSRFQARLRPGVRRCDLGAELPLLADGSPRPEAEVHDRPLPEGGGVHRSA